MGARLLLAMLLVTLPGCTLVGLGVGAGADHVLGTDHIGKEVGLRIGLGVDLTLIAAMMKLFDHR
ncbi:MAG: hypothetical protein ACM31C_02735 [Acidobacteriota bacterium]